MFCLYFGIEHIIFLHYVKVVGEKSMVTDKKTDCGCADKKEEMKVESDCGCADKKEEKTEAKGCCE